MFGQRTTPLLSLSVLIGATLLAWFLDVTFDHVLAYLGIKTQHFLPSGTPFNGTCVPARYTTELLSQDPLIIYINDFLTTEEIEALLTLGEDLFMESTVADDLSAPYKDPARTSSSAYLPGNDPVVRCVMAKASSFLGFFDYDEIEAPQLTKYGPSQEYRAHFDWPPQPWRDSGHDNQRFDRISTFFVYLEANCTGGSTHFPRVHIDDIPHLDTINDTKFEVVTEKSSTKEKSLAVRPITGNAVFWLNMVEQGIGHEKSFHAGMPVIEGTKVGLNIWSRRYYPDDEETVAV